MKKLKIVSIKKLEHKNDRYDLTVNRHHNFFANGVLIHNTSQRVGNCLEQLELGSFKQFFNKYIYPIFPTERWGFLNGTRNVILNYRDNKSFVSDEEAFMQSKMEHRKLNVGKFYSEKNGIPMSAEDYRSIFPEDDSFAPKDYTLDFLEERLPGFKAWFKAGRQAAIGDFHGDDFRERAAEPFRGKLRKGEVVYYEVVGYERAGKPIMPVADTSLMKDKGFTKTFGKLMPFKYGCMDGQFKILVYRIAYVTVEGFTIDLLWDDVKKRCAELGVDHVPEICPPFIYDGDVDRLKDFVAKNCDGPDLIDNSHVREGLCLRVDKNIGLEIYKEKGFSFKVLEGIIKDNDSYVDMEEVS